MLQLTIIADAVQDEEVIETVLEFWVTDENRSECMACSPLLQCSGSLFLSIQHDMQNLTAVFLALAVPLKGFCKQRLLGLHITANLLTVPTAAIVMLHARETLQQHLVKEV